MRKNSKWGVRVSSANGGVGGVCTHNGTGDPWFAMLNSRSFFLPADWTAALQAGPWACSVTARRSVVVPICNLGRWVGGGVVPKPEPASVTTLKLFFVKWTGDYHIPAHLGLASRFVPTCHTGILPHRPPA